MSPFTYDENSISDLHKDAYGFRPSESFWGFWAASNPLQKQACWESMIADLKQSMDEEAKEEAAAIVRFEDRVTNLMHSSTTREKIITWLMDAEDALGDTEYFEFLVGLPYGYIKKNYKM